MADDWEIIEDIPKVQIHKSISETFICPQCKKSDDYWPSYEQEVAEFGYFRCVMCNQKIKPIMPKEDSNQSIIDMVINPPDFITLDNKGKKVTYKKVSCP